MIVKLICEDYYGYDFFSSLIGRLKASNNASRQLHVNNGRVPPICNHKLDRVLKADTSSDKIIIIADGDGDSLKVRKNLDSHVPAVKKATVEIIVFEFEIEEWVCKSLKLDFHGTKPSECLSMLSRKKGSAKSPYHHKDLPSYSSKIDIPLLLRTDQHFQRFVSCLK